VQIKRIKTFVNFDKWGFLSRNEDKTYALSREKPVLANNNLLIPQYGRAGWRNPAFSMAAARERQTTCAGKRLSGFKSSGHKKIRAGSSP
jgi:hypothetical protein